MANTWKLNPPPLGKGNPWFVDDEDGQPVAIIPITLAGEAEATAKQIVRDHNEHVGCQAAVDAAVAELTAEVERLRKAGEDFMYRFEDAATGSNTTPAGRIAVDREQWRVATLMCQRFRAALGESWK